MEKKGRGTARPSEFAGALRELVDGSGLYERAQWSEILGVSLPAISQWVSDETIPKPEHLRGIVDTLVEDTRIKDEILEKFESVARRPAREISPHGDRLGPTVGHYMVRPLKDGVWRALDALPPLLQEAVLYEAGKRGWELRRGHPGILSIRERRRMLHDGKSLTTLLDDNGHNGVALGKRKKTG